MTILHELTVSGKIPQGDTAANVTYYVVNKSTGAVVNSIVLPDRSTVFREFSMIVKIPNPDDDYDCGVIDAIGAFTPSGFTLSLAGAATDPSFNSIATGAQGHRYDV